MSNKLNLTEEEQKKINTICDYLFFDQFSEILTFLRFERCFQPLFSEDKNFDIEEIFKEICGPKKKYLNYKRFVSSYLKYKENKVSKELKDFFDKLFNSILKEDHIGEFAEGKLTFSTRKANKNRESITKIGVLNDKEGALHGFIIGEMGFLVKGEKKYEQQKALKTEKKEEEAAPDRNRPRNGGAQVHIVHARKQR